MNIDLNVRVSLTGTTPMPRFCLLFLMLHDSRTFKVEQILTSTYNLIASFKVSYILRTQINFDSTTCSCLSIEHSEDNYIIKIEQVDQVKVVMDKSETMTKDIERIQRETPE